MLNPSHEYEYNGVTLKEGERIAPHAIMHPGYDATIDTLQCEATISYAPSLRLQTQTFTSSPLQEDWAPPSDTLCPPEYQIPSGSPKAQLAGVPHYPLITMDSQPSCFRWD